MPRRYRRRYARPSRPLKTVKYSNETSNFGGNVAYDKIPANGALVLSQNQAPVISAIAAQGMRKVKNISLNLQTNCQVPIVWALVYIPQGQNPSTLNFGQAPNSVSLYEPAQNVIMSGTVYVNSAQQTWRTRLARNLNSGDCIAFIFKQLIGVPQEHANDYVMFVQANYAITY